MEAIAEQARLRSVAKEAADAITSEKAAAEGAIAAALEADPERAAAEAAAREAAVKSAAAREEAAAKAAEILARGDAWVFTHSPVEKVRPGGTVTWARTQNGRSSRTLAHMGQGGIPLPESGRFVSMSNAELDNHFENDWLMNHGLDAHRHDVRRRLGRSFSSPACCIDSPTAALAKVSAWELKGQPRQVIFPYRTQEAWNDHALAPKLARSDPSGGPGEYCHKFMQTEVWRPRTGEFQSVGGRRTKCVVSQLETTWRWRYQDPAKRRMEGVTIMDGYTRDKPACGI